MKATKLMLFVLTLGMLVSIGAAQPPHDGGHNEGGYPHDNDHHNDFGGHYDWLNPGGMIYYSYSYPMYYPTYIYPNNYYSYWYPYATYYPTYTYTYQTYPTYYSYSMSYPSYYSSYWYWY